MQQHVEEVYSTYKIGDGHSLKPNALRTTSSLVPYLLLLARVISAVPPQIPAQLKPLYRSSRYWD
jgi:hypothetical protein